MKLSFLGVGEACDPDHGNTSFQVVTANGVHLLCDCGFTIPHTYFAASRDGEQLDLVWISHFHGDHFFGMPLLLLRLWEMGRRRPLTICGQRGVGEQIMKAMELAFSGFAEKLSFEVRFVEVDPGRPHTVAGLTMRTVETVHGQRNLGLFLDDGEKKLYYSGDGRPTTEVVDLVRHSDLAVHEAFKLNDEFSYHGSITGCLQLAEKSGVRSLALVHLERNFRRDESQTINTILQRNSHLILPVRGTELEI
ncbi:MAG: MBL fold metallo-hydrolase [Desulfobulbus sp.]|mgnify:CR=1 FL=1|nr:MAG: MBL fold metallo-hydrolase [Desulfobulbus sp.]